MFDFRSPLILSGPPLGLALGLTTWLLAGSGWLGAGPLTSREHSLPAAAATDHGANQSIADPIENAVAKPLFAMTTGPGAVTEAVISLQGLARSAHGASALLSINAKPSRWFGAGETSDDVLIKEVRRSSVVVDTPMGIREIGLWDRPAAASADAGAQSGSHMPPPPASAPGMGG